MRAVALGVLTLWAAGVEALVPGIGRDYRPGDSIAIKTHGLNSIHSQVPYSLYHLPYCRPPDTSVQVESLGELLLGEGLQATAIDAVMLKESRCHALCAPVPMSAALRRRFRQMIDDSYSVELIADGLPAVSPHKLSGETETLYTLGFPVGWKELDAQQKPHYFVYNYLAIVFKYTRNALPQAKGRFFQSPASETYQLVGFDVVPMVYVDSTASTSNYCEAFPRSAKTGNAVEDILLARAAIGVDHVVPLDEIENLQFVVDIRFEYSEMSYTERWDAYVQSQRLGIDYEALKEVHWFSLLNSLVVVFLLSIVVATILLRTLRRDIAKYNELLVDAEDDNQEVGWKLVHGDVFRKPPHSTLLAALTGSGLQVMTMALMTLSIASIGAWLRPSVGVPTPRLLQAGLMLWSFMGVGGGYAAARLYKFFQSPNWKTTTLRTAMVYPGMVFSTFLVVNIFLAISGSSAATPFGGIFLLLLIWFGISAPLVFFGAFLGFRQPPLTLPVRVNRIPRQLPTQPLVVHPFVLCLVGGALPFGAVFAELLFLFSSIWMHRMYLLFPLLLAVAAVLIVTCAEVAIAATYFTLVCEDYRWWWKSFYVPASSGVYVFAYALFYAFTKLQLTRFTSFVLFVGYSFIMSFTFGIITGTVGFLSSLVFVRAIYGSIRVD